ncbi:MAG: hypothetical protein LQ343_006912 [Gyalolechia ehrenbergii]|nr:MAG: hypothetical protein LQ343_006912 [Gyalolechia ehrenbergii]
MKTAWLSTWSMGIRWVQQSSAYAVNYYDRLTRYLQGVREHEQRMQELRASYDPNQPLSETSSLALSASRKDVIEFIAARVGLRPDEVPYLAFAGEPVVRIQVQQKYGVGPLKPIQDIWGQAYQGMGRAIHPWSRWLGRLSRNVRDWTEILIATINLMPRVIGSLVLGYVVLDVFKFLKWLGRCFELL